MGVSKWKIWMPVGWDGKIDGEGFHWENTDMEYF